MFVSSYMSVRVAVRVPVRVSLSTLFDRENKYLYVCVGTSCTNQCIAPLRIIPRCSMTHGTLGGTLHVASGSLLLPLHVPHFHLLRRYYYLHPLPRSRSRLPTAPQCQLRARRKRPATPRLILPLLFVQAQNQLLLLATQFL